LREPRREEPHLFDPRFEEPHFFDEPCRDDPHLADLFDLFEPHLFDLFEPHLFDLFEPHFLEEPHLFDLWDLQDLCDLHEPRSEPRSDPQLQKQQALGAMRSSRRSIVNRAGLVGTFAIGCVPLLSIN
jgi:hypothetical protein